MLRVLRGTGDTWDSRVRARGITASSSLNGIGLVPDDPPDLYQENEELKVPTGLLLTSIGPLLNFKLHHYAEDGALMFSITSGPFRDG